MSIDVKEFAKHRKEFSFFLIYWVTAFKLSLLLMPFSATKTLFAIRPLQTLGAPCLRVVANEVQDEMFGSKRLSDLVVDLIDTMRDANGAGIAAPQIGEPWRVFVVHGTGNNPRYPYKPEIPLTVFVNPIIEVIDDKPMQLVEGCLSVPGFRGRVKRACKVRCRAQRPEDGSWFTLKAEGHAAGTLQHELDHLDARLFPDLAGIEGLMTADSFETHVREDFFEYAAKINQEYPTPLIWEEGKPSNSVNNSDMTISTKSDIIVYQAQLTWTGKKFEECVSIKVSKSSGKIIDICHNPHKTLHSNKNEENIVYLPDRAIIPGFVNAHSHVCLHHEFQIYVFF